MKKTVQKLTSNDLLSIIRSHRRDSLGAEDGDLSNDRARAMDHYHGRPYGNEQEGRSQVVSRDLAEAVDWAMPAIMRVFVQSGSLGEFDPVGPEDEELAQQESDYTNQVIMKDNPGFMILHDAIKDTLLLRNGYVKHYWDESTKISDEEYSGLTMDDITRLMTELQADGAEVDVKAATPSMAMVAGPMGEVPLEVFDIKLQIKRKTGKVCIEAVPAEEVRISKKCRGSLQGSPFNEHVTRKTRSELIEMGMDADFAYSLPAYNEADNTQETIARDSVSDERDVSGAAIVDRSMDEIEYCEAYLRVDWDGDGIAELRKVVTVADKLPPGEEWNETLTAMPMTGFVAKRMPHRHVGESLDDELADLQEIKTVLLRQLLDNIYLTNNQQIMVNERANLVDFMQSLPGGIKRIKGEGPVGDAVMPLITTPIVDQILPVVDFFNGVKESRTGISRASTGLDPDILKQSTKGAFLENLNRATQKIEMIVRLIAETGIKELMLQVHALLIQHQDKARVVKMRGNWVPVNPQEWRERTDLTARVGLGTGNEEEKRQKLLLLSGLQDKLAAMNLVGPKQAFEMFEDICNTLGFDMPEKYAMSPDSPEFQQMMANRKPPPNPMVEVEQAKGQVTLQKAQLDANVEMQKQEKQLEFDRWQTEMEQRTKLAEAEMQAKTSLKQTSLTLNQNISPDSPTEYGDDGNLRPRQTLADLMAEVNTGLQQMFEQQQVLSQRHDEIKQMMAGPRQIQLQRGPDGRVTHVNGRPVVRDQSGRATGLG